MPVAPMRKFAKLAAFSPFTTPFTRFTAVLAGLSALGSAAPAGADPNGPATRPEAVEAHLVVEGNVITLRPDGKSGAAGRVFEIGEGEGRPVTIRIVEADEGEGAGKGADDDVVRRLRERRRAEEAKDTKGQKGRDADTSAKDTSPKEGPKKEAKPGADKKDGGGEAADSAEAARAKLQELLKARQRLLEAQRQDRPERGEREKNPRSAKVEKGEKAEKVAFLGISPAQVPPVLAKQLKLPAEVGLVVEEVQPGSPAEQAGLRKYDVLQKMDDQLLIDPHQLVVLVRGHKTGETVSLGGIREGQPFNAKVKLAEHEVPAEAEGREGDEPELRYHIIPPSPPNGQEGPSGPRSWKPEGPLVIPLPLAPGEAVPPARREAKPQVKPEAEPQGENAKGRKEVKPNPEARPNLGAQHQAKPGAPSDSGEQGRLREQGDREVRELESQLQELRTTAQRLRAQVKEQEQQGQGNRGGDDRKEREEQ